MEQSSALEGLVHDTMGNPIPGAVVAAPLYPSQIWTPAEARSGADGRFRVELPPGRPAMMAVWAQGFRLGFFRVSPGGEPVSIQLSPIGPHADVEIRRPDGRGVEGVRLFWNLAIGGFEITGEILERAFLLNRCGLMRAVVRSRTRIGGCLMPAAYSLLIDDPSGSASRIVTKPFDPTQGDFLTVETVEKAVP